MLVGFLTQFVSPPPSDDTRLFAFVRITTGDAMSKRTKFTLITWVGKNISGLKLAKISTDKAMVKDIVQVRDSEVLQWRAVIQIMIIRMPIKTEQKL